MSHQFAGAPRAVEQHVRAAAVHQQAFAAQPLTEFKGTHQTIDTVAGITLRARESLVVFGDIITDATLAKSFLQGTALEGQPPVGDFSALAHDACDASAQSKAALVSALEDLIGSLQARLDVLHGVLTSKCIPAARAALTKTVAAGAFDLETLHRHGGIGFSLAQETPLHAHLPDSFIKGRSGFTPQGIERISGLVMKDYLRDIEDQKILADEFAAHDAREAKKALRDRALSALSQMGV